MTPTDEAITWTPVLLILLAFVVGAAVLAIVHAEHRRREAAGQRSDAEHRRREVPVHPHCVVYGHAFRAHQTVYLCGVCGDRIPRNTLLLEEEDIA